VYKRQIQAYALRAAPSDALVRGDVEDVLRDVEALVRRVAGTISH